MRVEGFPVRADGGVGGCSLQLYLFRSAATTMTTTTTTAAAFPPSAPASLSLLFFLSLSLQVSRVPTASRLSPPADVPSVTMSPCRDEMRVCRRPPKANYHEATTPGSASSWSKERIHPPPFLFSLTFSFPSSLSISHSHFLSEWVPLPKQRNVLAQKPPGEMTWTGPLHRNRPQLIRTRAVSAV